VNQSTIIRALALFSAIALGAPTVAFAAQPGADAVAPGTASRVAELNEAGAKHYGDRNYRLAIEKFIEAYAIDHDPNLLFNIARCYEELGDLDAAIEKYEDFTDQKGADAEGRLRAHESLETLRALKRARAGESVAPAAASAAGEPDHERARREPDGSPEPRSFLPWALLGSGVVVASVGGTLYVLGARDHERVTSAPGFGNTGDVHPMTRAEAQSLVDAGDTKKLLGGVGVGLGGALLTTSIVLFLSGGETMADADSSATLSLDPGPDRFSAYLRGRF
jgi:hypothetical protein